MTDTNGGDPPVDELAANFLNEDLSKPENRINVALYGAQAIPEFWAECREHLGLSEDAVLRRVLLAGEQSRPDFQVIEGGKATRWIEAELGGRNVDQLKRYSKAVFDPPEVLSLVGPKVNRHGDPSLSRIAEIAAHIAPVLRETNPPAREVLNCLAEMIRKGVTPETAGPKTQPIPDRLMALPWFAQAVAPLLELDKAGFVLNRTTDPGSLSLRLKAGPSVRCQGSFALLTQRGEGPDFQVPDPAEMGRIFKDPLDRAVPHWRMLLDRVRPRWSAHIAGNKRIGIAPSVLQEHAAEFAAFYRYVRNRLMSGSPPAPETLAMDEEQGLLLVQQGGFTAELTREQASGMAEALAAFAAADRHADLPDAMKARIGRQDPLPGATPGEL